MKFFTILRNAARCAGAASVASRPRRLLARVLPAIFVLASCTAPVQRFGSGRLNASEKMMWSTYPMGSEKGMGTGFVVLRRDRSAPGGSVPVVVTAGHLLDAIGRRPFFIGARMPDAKGDAQVALIEFKPPRDNARFFSRDARHDIGVFELRIPPEFASQVSMPSFLSDAMRTGRRLRAGEEVSFVGFPEVLPEMEGAFPILRTGRVASYPVGVAAAEGVFVINADVYPGDSGAPVFVTGRAGRPELAGMIIRRVGSDQKAFSHLAIAVDARAVYEAVNSLAAKSGRGE
ncbi:MAG: serine protease [Verrucomicrobiaceae bacterium]|nr:serine protease [Verrucomicrobiaceae bacterium]